MAKPKSHFPTTRMTLIERMRKMDNSAWTTFFEIYGPIVYRFARRARLDDHDAEEVVAAVVRNMLRVMRGGFELDPELGRFRDYLRSVTNREISAQIRRRKLSSPLITDPGAEDGTWAELERQEVLAVCLERLRRSRAVRARDLLAFERYALQDEPADSVARDLQISKSRLYAIKHEMIQRLRRLRESLEAVIEEEKS
ncbi:MAG: sigma-70 family RNA polymerase sigma factor [Planctomycetes bacterium]|nr:sigma-70 family RNA polymerase sigma factor [Planctomycetota bacterium]